jgi:PilZ domain-containing protein
MYPTGPNDLLRSALSLLPPLPCSVDVIADDGGSFTLMLAATEANLVYGYGNRSLVRDDGGLSARIRDDSGEGWDVRFTVLRTYFQSGDDLLLHLNVESIETRTAERRTPRAHLAELATARIVYSARQAHDVTFDVRLADASATGIAFITERELDTGDLIEIDAVVNERHLNAELRVLRTIPAVYGRNRVGCEITRILDADRHALTVLAERYQRKGSPDDRDPALLETRKIARIKQTLAERRAPRYHTD